ncbi:hypothetical protein EJ03DRAFT_331120 [Teratosphaeria nubilosa]|uniref:Uncharacterized protein n=1 Tax=Teratosphaeria nubilosa TaxID=161662 RepID=A0A6G1KX31_9PEZI|nr:hypothetical protein EJ03DRAFT_331120 [Teratosphaeria nubilosa]
MKQKLCTKVVSSYIWSVLVSLQRATQHQTPREGADHCPARDRLANEDSAYEDTTTSRSPETKLQGWIAEGIATECHLTKEVGPK